MPTGKVFNSPTIKVNGVDLTDHCDKATVSQSLQAVDVTPFGAQNTVNTPGIGDAKIDAEFFQDYAASKTHATLIAMFNNSRSGVAGTVEIVPDSTTSVSATNPRITMTAFLLDYTGFDGEITAASKIAAPFVNAGTAGITYGTV